MMNDKEQWEVANKGRQNEKEINKLIAWQSEVVKWMVEIDKFQTKTIERLITVFKRIENIEEANKWISRLSVATLLGGVASVLGALIVWLIKG